MFAFARSTDIGTPTQDRGISRQLACQIARGTCTEVIGGAVWLAVRKWKRYTDTHVEGNKGKIIRLVAVGTGWDELGREHMDWLGLAHIFHDETLLAPSYRVAAIRWAGVLKLVRYGAAPVFFSFNSLRQSTSTWPPQQIKWRAVFVSNFNHVERGKGRQRLLEPDQNVGGAACIGLLLW